MSLKLQNRTSTRGQHFSSETELNKTQSFDSTDQLCDLFLYDLFDPDVVYLVMTAQLLCNCWFTHSWRSNQADSEWLGTQRKQVKEIKPW